MMKLFLHTPSSKTQLNEIYKRAMRNAKELFIVTAYLTDWDKDLELNDRCGNFRIIIGKDFGITRKAACEKVLRWLPAERKHQFMVADQISGFHPKAIFWKDHDNEFYSLIGSSNLSRAAFSTNYEANIYTKITEKEYDQARSWIKNIESLSFVVSEDWLSKYQEGQESPKKKEGKSREKKATLIALKLPKPRGSKKAVEKRRGKLVVYNQHKEDLLKLFRYCAKEKISSSDFYEKLPEFWSWELGNRLQGLGWERQGRASDFQQIARSFIEILDANQGDRDDVVVRELNSLCTLGVPARKAFLSEMLCLALPTEYPVLNKPVKDYLTDIKFKAPRGVSEGGWYLDLAKKLRFSILQNPRHPAKNLAELDTVIWLQYGKKKKAKRASS